MRRLLRAAEMSCFMGAHRRLPTDAKARREPGGQGRAGRLGQAGEERPLGQDKCPQRLRAQAGKPAHQHVGHRGDRERLLRLP